MKRTYLTKCIYIIYKSIIKCLQFNFIVLIQNIDIHILEHKIA